MQHIDYSYNLLQKIKFDEYVAQWKKNTKYYSFSNQIINDPNFQNILKMGYVAVPFIVEEIKARPSFLVWALNILYNVKISNNPNATLEEVCKKWVQVLN
jgi:hypothetical protein